MSFQGTPNNHDEENKTTGYNLRRRTVTTGTGAVPKTTMTNGHQNTPVSSRNNHRGTNDNPVKPNNEGLNNQNKDERVNSHSVLNPHFPVYNIRRPPQQHRNENIRATHPLSPSRDIR
ncbi:hypothetical protein HHI36_023701 [Cryptolaemus montrouzieri]|uniref:Uncharacterized protein n=1 Tax=Cryptolaemus montrouzieri TaxID=559131 RepID=A0ABD2PH79_9CUCU